MITSEQAKQYLKSQGIDTDSTPDFIINAWVEQANSIQDCLDANYTVNTALLIQCYLISLLAYAQSDQMLSSQTAPSGASRSFKYKNFADRWKGQLNLLRSLDKSGCTVDLIPSDPTVSSFGGLWVGKGGCH
ncbi:hypothetical protein H8F10_13070 [Vibrio fluvialis]|uniref:DUF7370 family protein n=1 Tax=Vibrio fluvialis TaxID=676 RepID=UPI00192BC8AC|nr:hypothetical protein [Vibrio fluvialis]MBL4278847.1 hypothetical protein [Vibrio fluvialis]